MALASARAQQGGNATSTVTGGSVTGGNVQGGSTTGGTTGTSVTGPSVTGGSVKGGNVTGATVTGGTVTGGTVTGGTVTGGTVTSGNVTPGSVSAGTASATVDGRQVTARAAGGVSISSNGSNANVTLGTHTVIVQKESLIIDGQERGKIPAGASTVAIEVANGQLTISADGKSALAVPIKANQ